MKQNLIGKKFGKLTVLDYAFSDENGNSVWNCICDCGNRTTSTTAVLNKGAKKSCGCLAKETARNLMKTSPSLYRKKHGGTNERLYRVYRSMISRCNNPKNKRFDRYGARGISVCSEWINSYSSFRDWAISNGYDESADCMQCTIDRIDVNGNYCPENCRFANSKTQNNNRSNNKLITAFGKTKTVSEWSDELGMNPFTIYSRLHHGIDGEKALSKFDLRKVKVSDNGTESPAV